MKALPLVGVTWAPPPVSLLQAGQVAVPSGTVVGLPGTVTADETVCTGPLTATFFLKFENFRFGKNGPGDRRWTGVRRRAERTRRSG